jgi:hypothetical protein
MTKFHWDTLTGHSQPAANIEQPPATDAAPVHLHHSKLSHVMETIRHALAHEHETVPRSSTTAHQETTTGAPISPALQAVVSTKLNENNMGEGSHQNDETWGWPGLGSFSSQRSGTSHDPKPHAAPAASEAGVESKVEAATFEAIDNAAESETYGWPGLGDWNATARK